MLADMHCHYPMHVAAQAPTRPLAGTPKLTVEAMTRVSRRPGWLEKLRAGALKAGEAILSGNAMRMARTALGTS
ncbi:MAG: hypothetical protein WD810_00145 [Solirubrobacterales bacterium]